MIDAIDRLSATAKDIAEFCRRWGVARLDLFGSILRDDFSPESDVDVLVAFTPEARPSLFDLVRMQDELSELFGRRVDLIERAAIERSPNYLRRRSILESAHGVYAA